MADLENFASSEDFKILSSVESWAQIPAQIWRGFFEGKIASQDVSLLVAGYTIAPCMIDDVGQNSAWYVAKKIRSINQNLILQETDRCGDCFSEYVRLKGGFKYESNLCKINTNSLPVLESGELVSMQYAFSEECSQSKKLQMIKKLFEHPGLVVNEDKLFAKDFRILMITLGVYLRDCNETLANKIVIFDSVCAMVAVLEQVNENQPKKLIK
jgi:ribulose bisphosphate carboxylase small subunit